MAVLFAAERNGGVPVPPTAAAAAAGPGPVHPLEGGGFAAAALRGCGCQTISPGRLEWSETPITGTRCACPLTRLPTGFTQAVLA